MLSLSSLLPNLSASLAAPEGAAGKGDTSPAKDGFSALLTALQPSAAPPVDAASAAPLPLTHADLAQLELAAGTIQRQPATEGGNKLPVALPGALPEGSPDGLPNTGLAGTPVLAATTAEAAPLLAQAAPKVSEPAPLVAEPLKVETPSKSEPALKVTRKDHPRPVLEASSAAAESPAEAARKEQEPAKALIETVTAPEAVLLDVSLVSEPVSSPLPLVAPLPESGLAPQTAVPAPAAGEQALAPRTEAQAASAAPTEHRSPDAKLFTPTAAPAAARPSEQPETGAAQAPSVTLHVASHATPAPAAAVAQQAIREADIRPATVAETPKLKSTKPAAGAPAVELARSVNDNPVAQVADLTFGSRAVQPDVAPAQPASPAVHDLARIVDRLAAAREAFLPAAAEMSIDHAEFGELSLRIDQRVDGGLSVQLSAADPEANQAVKAAVAADRSPFAGGETPSNNQGQASQQSSSQSSGQPQARGGFADRDTHGGSAGNRQDQPSSRQGSARDGTEKHTDARRDGIFA